MLTDVQKKMLEHFRNKAARAFAQKQAAEAAHQDAVNDMLIAGQLALGERAADYHINFDTLELVPVLTMQREEMKVAEPDGSL